MFLPLRFISNHPFHPSTVLDLATCSSQRCMIEQLNLILILNFTLQCPGWLLTSPELEAALRALRPLFLRVARNVALISADRPLEGSVWLVVGGSGARAGAHCSDWTTGACGGGAGGARDAWAGTSCVTALVTARPWTD